MKKTKKIWFDGKFLDWQKAKIHLLTHSLHYGGAVFEGIRCYRTVQNKTAIFRLSEHIQRFFCSAKVLEMEIPYSQAKIKKAILETIKINKLKEGYIRPIAFFGYGKMGLNPQGASVNIAIACWPWGSYLEKEIVKVKISNYIRLHPRSCPMEAKITGYYINSILTSLEAKKTGFDEALLLDYQGYVAEGPGENIFMIKNNKLYTPSLGTILPGITRASVIEIAKDLGISVKEKKITLKEIKSANEVFFTGTAVEICPIGQIDETLINNGQVGQFTKKIKEVFEKTIRGEEKRYLKWLTFV